VTTPERAGSTINVRDVGLVITLRLVVAKTGGIMEATVILLADLGGGAINSINNVEGRTTLASSAVIKSPIDSGW